MSDTINDGGPAFPQISELGDIAATSGGMSLRAYLAAHAPVTLHDAALVCGYDGMEDAFHNDQTRAITLAIMAMMRAEYADALIAELAKGGAQ